MKTIEEAINSNMPIVLVADDHAIVRRGIRMIFSQNKWDYFLLECDNIKCVLKTLRNYGAHIKYAILDLNLNDGSLLNILPVINNIKADLPILIYSVVESEIFARRLLQLGIRGFVNKNSSLEELELALVRIFNNEYYFNDQFQYLLVQIVSQKAVTSNPFEALSDRELQVCQYLIKGMSLNEIAVKMGLATSTTHTYKYRSFEKLGVSNLLELKEMFIMYDIKQRDI